MVLIGATSLVKGIGFGAVLILSVVAGVLIWQRRFCFASSVAGPGGMGLGGRDCLSWPLFMVVLHGYGALSLWTMHVSDRLIPSTGPWTVCW